MNVLSADSHVTEPGDLWATRLPARFRDRAPRYVRNEQAGQDEFVCEGWNGVPVGLFSAAGRDSETLSAYGASAEDFRAGGYDPAARLADQDLDGVAAEVLYPTAGMLLGGVSDPELRHRCYTAYNDWLAEFVAHAPGRLVGVAMLPVADPGAACQELERACSLGLRGGLIPPSPIGTTYADDAFEPLWETAEALRVPLSVHFGAKSAGDDNDRSTNQQLGTVLDMAGFMRVVHGMQSTIAVFVFGGILERHPALQLVSAENDAGWLPYYLARMDSFFERHRFWLGNGLAERLPSACVLEQVSFTFMRDPVALSSLDPDIVPRLMWGNDYPHSESTFPRSREILEEDFRGVAPDHADRILWGNAADLYGLHRPAPV